jgi:hypothetical protein
VTGPFFGSAFSQESVACRASAVVLSPVRPIRQQIGRTRVRAWSDGWLGVVVDAPPDLPGAFDAGQSRDQVQCHVDPGADAGGGDEVAVIDPAVVRTDLNGRFERAQLVHRTPVRGRRPPAEQPGSGVHQRAVAHAGHQGDGGALRADPVEVFRVAKQRPGALAAGVDEHLMRRRVRDGVVCAQHQALAAVTGRPSCDRQDTAQPSSGWLRVQKASHGPTASSSSTPSNSRMPIWRGVVLGSLVMIRASPRENFVARGRNAHIHEDAAVHRIVALALPEVVAFDLSIPAQVFGHRDERERYSFAVCAARAARCPPPPASRFTPRWASRH